MAKLRASFTNEQLRTAKEKQLLRDVTLSMVISTGILIAAVSIGSLDSEFSNRADLNWGSAYLLEKPDGSSRGVGITRLLGVPVFDGAQGFGFRLPNFVTIPHLSPLILLNQWVPSYFLSVGVSWMSLVLLLIAVRMTLSSWHSQQMTLRQFAVVPMALAPIAVYFLYNDWGIVLAGTLSSFTIVTCLLHKSLFIPEIHGDRPRVNKTIAALMLAAFALQLSGHPRFLFLAVPIYFVLAKQLARTANGILRSPALLMASLLILLAAGLALREYLLIGGGGGGVREMEPSALDFISESDNDSRTWRKWVFTGLSQMILPILRIAYPGRPDLIHSRVEFLNLTFFIALISLGRTLLRTSVHRDVITAAKHAVTVGLLWMVFGLPISKQLPLLRGVFLQDGWDLSYVVAFVGALGAAIALPESWSSLYSDETTRRGTRQLGLLAFAFGVIMAVLFPLGLVLNAPVPGENAPRRDWIMVSNASGTQHIDFSDFSGAGRTGYSDPTPSGCISRETWELKTGLSHPVVLAREGVPTVESFPAFRVAGLTLRPVGNSREDLIYVCDTMTGLECSPEVLDFLSFREFPPLGLASQCKSLQRSSLPSPDSTATASLNASGSAEQAFGLYHNFFVRPSSVAFYSSFNCSLFDGCLSAASQGAASTPKPPWSICKSDCWFTYKVLESPPEDRTVLLLPVRFDEALRVSVPEQPDTRPKTLSFRGLLAVDVSEITKPQIIKISLDRDSRQWRVAAMPYLMLLAMVLLILATWRTQRQQT